MQVRKRHCLLKWDLMGYSLHVSIIKIMQIESTTRASNSCGEEVEALKNKPRSSLVSYIVSEFHSLIHSLIHFGYLYNIVNITNLLL